MSSSGGSATSSQAARGKGARAGSKTARAPHRAEPVERRLRFQARGVSRDICLLTIALALAMAMGVFRFIETDIAWLDGYEGIRNAVGPSLFGLDLRNALVFCHVAPGAAAPICFDVLPTICNIGISPGTIGLGASANVLIMGAIGGLGHPIGASDTTLRTPSPNVCRFSTDGAPRMAGLGRHIHGLGIRKVAATTGDDAFPCAQVFGFNLECFRLGGRVTHRWAPLGTTDFTSQIAQINRSNAGAAVRLDRDRQAISAIFLNRVEERGGHAVVAFDRARAVNRALGMREPQFLALGSPSRDDPGCVA